MERAEILSLHMVITTLTFYLLLHPTSAVTANPSDAAVIVTLSKSLTPPGWTGPNPCDYPGVNCDSSGHVTRLNLASKSLSGQIPSEITQLSHLTTLSLQRNRFSGPFPSLNDLPSLQQIFLDENNFSSIPTPFLKGLTSLQWLSIGENPILPPWTLPETLKESTALTNLSVESCKLSGFIPDIFGAMPSLQNVRLSYNNLTGPLPASLAKSGVRNLWINDQEEGLSGRISVLGAMADLTQVWLHGNKFYGPIPDFPSATSLTDLSLHDNHLTGPIPPSLSTLPKLTTVSLQNNKLQGPFPSFPSNFQVKLGTTNNFCNSKPGPCDTQVTILLEIAKGFGYPMTLAESWSGNNPCQGWKSVTCDSSGKITILNFAKQGFVGHISISISNITTLTNILLNDNNLTGTIPPSLANLPQLRVLDISNNNISGKIPKFGASVALKTSGNPFIGKDVAIVDPTTDTFSDESPSGGTTTESGSKNSEWVIAVVIVIIGLILGAIFYVLYARLAKRRREKLTWAKHWGKGSRESSKRGIVGGPHGDLPTRSNGDNSEIQVFDGRNVSVPIEKLREVTDNFSENNILGRGGFGVVYRGELHDGTKIAVKRMEAAVDSSKGLNEFQAEIAVLSKVRHRHLVALYGFCIHGNERLLVYEHMPQGTLGQRLFTYVNLEVPPLTWKQRLQIALDVARGVEYLHSLAQQSFIHRDLKPSNVLLGDDMRAKVSDFGLVKNAPDGKYSVETRLAGTFGYLAPEYASTGRVTTKIDVFAFGVILMEIITGRRALDESLPDDKSHLVAWFRKYINHRDSIRTYLDPSLDPDDEDTFDSICKVAELSGHCTAREPHQRPDMGHAVNVLSPLVDQWRPTTGHDEEDSFGIDYHVSLPQALQKWQAGEGNSLVPPSGYYGSYTSSAPQGTSGVASSFSSKDTA